MHAHKENRSSVFRKLAALYHDMETSYAKTAKEIGLSCMQCENNCCTSYFMHHTYVEWAYLWKGINALPEDDRALFLENATSYVKRSRTDLANGTRPHSMCPLNKDGLCGLYTHRLMICRMHGVPNKLTAPNGASKIFPGCWKSQELILSIPHPPILDRTSLYLRLVKLELAFVGPQKIHTLPRVNMTLAEMLEQGPPKI